MNGPGDFIRYLAQMGIVDGYPDGTFRPKQPAKRWEFAMVLTRLADVLTTRFGVKKEALGRKGLKSPDFVDIPFCWYDALMVRWLAEKGVFSPHERYFRWGEPITRYDAFLWTARLLGWQFDDLAVEFLKRNKIVEGYPDGQLHLDKFLSRYEMALIAHRVLERFERKALE